jgi:ABC-2 type transport system permease protein
MYLAFAQSAFQSQLAYRGEVWARLFGDLVFVFARIAIWMSVYQGASSIAGVTLAEMITYAVLGDTVFAAWSYANLINSIGRTIKTGDVAVFLLKPLRYPLYLLATECGNLVYRVLTVVLPIAAVVALTYGMLPPPTTFHGLMFVAYWVLGFAILFLFATLFGLLAFWLMTAFSLEWLLQSVLTIFSGTFIPLWFFPDALAAVVRFLPVAWVAYYPAAVYLGKLTIGDCWTFLGIGFGWALVLAGAVALLWGRTANRLTIQGG